MANLMKELVSGVVESVLKEILKKAGGTTATKRQKRQTRSATTGRFKKAPAAKAKPAKKTDQPPQNGGIAQQDQLKHAGHLLPSCKPSIFVVLG